VLDDNGRRWFAHQAQFCENSAAAGANTSMTAALASAGPTSPLISSRNRRGDIEIGADEVAPLLGIERAAMPVESRIVLRISRLIWRLPR
jgi:hypothetical protein